MARFVGQPVEEETNQRQVPVKWGGKPIGMVSVDDRPKWSSLPGNVLPNAYEVGKGMMQSIMHPKQTAESLGQIIAGGATKLLPGEKNLATRQFEEKFEAFTQNIKNRYGGFENIKKSIIETPVETALDVATLAVPAGKAISAVKDISGIRKISAIESSINKVIDNGIFKAVRPSVGKKRTAGSINMYKQKARVAVREIIENKDNLTLLDRNGLPQKGLPRTMGQFLDSIDQTKRKIYKEYDALVPEGVPIDLKSIGNELDIVIDNKSLKTFSPETIDYAMKMKDKLSTSDKFTAVETQEAIKFLNQKNEAFYKNPNPDMGGKAMVDALVANKLRNQLDMAIEGGQYQVLKNKYGALKEIERDVARRAIVDQRKAPVGLIDFSNVYTGYHVLKGVMGMEPSTVAAGALSKMIARRIKVMNDPNKIVEKMFKNTETLINTQKKYKF